MKLTGSGFYIRDVILSRDWDVLVILDGCRYDIFRELYGGKFNVLRGFSCGSCTVEWFYNCFVRDNVRLGDVIYISGNPYVGNWTVDVVEGITYNASNHFYRVVEVWKHGFMRIGVGYTVNPYSVLLSFIINRKVYGGFRFIVHFLQPHAPYPYCECLRGYFTDDIRRPDFKLWSELEKGKVDPKVVRECYIDNLKWVMKYVFDLLEYCSGCRVIITSDHGEAFMEHGIADHPCFVDDPVLTTVPLVYV